MVSKLSRTSSLVMASSDSELSRTAWRIITASNQPGRRRRLVLTPYSWPTSTMRSPRSEEHTSELQSLMRHSYAGFCLKKKTIKNHKKKKKKRTTEIDNRYEKINKYITQ